jgi:3-mercaptopyruvate sulfurtransferase SseA
LHGVGAEKSKKLIAYCGGGISATVDLLLLLQLGCENWDMKIWGRRKKIIQ